MAATAETPPDLLAVACVVEASLTLASEWPRILLEYMFPLLKRLTELHPTYQFRLAVITYGAANTRPSPLLSKRFFGPPAHVTKELREEPAKLGIGQISCGDRGLSALEGLVAAIEFFDILMTSTNPSIGHPQKENRSLVSHILHIAASPPDNVQRPQWNMSHHLDSVTWDTLPLELNKRKINLSLISLRKIQQFQDLQLSVAGSGVQSPWFTVHAPHVLSLSGFPAPQKATAKRPTESSQLDRNTELKRQKVGSNETGQKAPSASPALSAAHTPNQRPMRPPSAQPPQAPAVSPTPQLTGAQPPSVARPSHENHQHNTSTSTTPSTSQATLPQPGFRHPAIHDQVITRDGHTIGQLMRQLEADIKTLDDMIADAQSKGQSVAELQERRAAKWNSGMQVRAWLQSQLRSKNPPMAVQANQSATPVMANADIAHPVQASRQADPSTLASGRAIVGISGPAGDKAATATVEEKIQTSDVQSATQFWQSRGGAVNMPTASMQSLGINQQSLPPTSSELAVQMQKLIDREGFRPPTSGLASQASSSINSHNMTVMNAQNQHLTSSLCWQGTFSWTLTPANGQGPKEMQVQAIGIRSSQIAADLLSNTWPSNFSLTFCKEPLKDFSELQGWLRSHQPGLVHFKPNPQANDPTTNQHIFYSLLKIMRDRRMYSYAGWQLPAGHFSNNIVIFPVNETGFGGAVFPVNGLPDLPGSGNTLEAVKPPAEAHQIRDPRNLNLPPAIMAQLQNMEPAMQAQFLMKIARQMQMRRQQQPSQPQGPSAQDVTNAANAVTPVGNMPLNFPTNAASASRPAPSGPYGGGSRAVNMEIMQSFMQRNADGPSSQGTNLG